MGDKELELDKEWFEVFRTQGIPEEAAIDLAKVFGKSTQGSAQKLADEIDREILMECLRSDK